MPDSRVVGDKMLQEWDEFIIHQINGQPQVFQAQLDDAYRTYVAEYEFSSDEMRSLVEAMQATTINRSENSFTQGSDELSDGFWPGAFDYVTEELRGILNSQLMELGMDSEIAGEVSSLYSIGSFGQIDLRISEFEQFSSISSRFCLCPDGTRKCCD